MCGDFRWITCVAHGVLYVYLLHMYYTCIFKHVIHLYYTCISKHAVHMYAMHLYCMCETCVLHVFYTCIIGTNCICNTRHTFIITYITHVIHMWHISSCSSFYFIMWLCQWNKSCFCDFYYIGHLKVIVIIWKHKW